MSEPREDYKHSDWWCCRCCQARPLRLQGKRLKVKKAPEPSNIVWENLDTPAWSQTCRRLLTALLTVFLISFSFFIVYAAQVSWIVSL